jgi:hypothetical protein
MPGEYDYGLDPGKFRAEVDAANRRVDAAPDGRAAPAIDKAMANGQFTESGAVLLPSDSGTVALGKPVKGRPIGDIRRITLLDTSAEGASDA